MSCIYFALNVKTFQTLLLGFRWQSSKILKVMVLNVFAALCVCIIMNVFVQSCTVFLCLFMPGFWFQAVLTTAIV